MRPRRSFVAKVAQPSSPDGPELHSIALYGTFDSRAPPRAETPPTCAATALHTGARRFISASDHTAFCSNHGNLLV